MPKTPQTILTNENCIVTLNVPFATALVYNGVEVLACEPLDDNELPILYVYNFPDDERTLDLMRQFKDGKLLVEPNKFWGTMISLHKKYHERTES